MARGGNQTTQTRNVPQARSSFFSGPAEIVAPRLILIVAVFALTILGLVMVYSSSSIEAISEGSNATAYVFKQALITGGSIFICLLIAVRAPYYKWLSRALDLFWMGIMALLLLTALVGTVGLGAKRWIVLGPINFQPAEFAKVAIVLMMARLLFKFQTEEYTFEQFCLRIGVLVLVPLGIILLLQSDLGTTMICVVGILGVLWIGEVPTPVFVLITAIAIGLGILAIVLTGYRSSRMSFLDPYADPYGSGYQLIHSFYAFGEGGLLGVGLGNSHEKYLYLPEAETDFIFAILAEEMGLVGALIVIALFLAVMYAGMKIARNAPDLFGATIAGGCTLMLVFQAFLNIGCVLGILPTTGKPLPFISSGGSAMFGSFLLVGVILSVSLASGADSGVYAQRRDDLRFVRNDNYAPSSTGGRRTSTSSSSSRGRASSGSSRSSARSGNSSRSSSRRRS